MRPTLGSWLARSMWRKQGLTVALAVAGTVIFWWADFPLPFLFGPLVACVIGALAGMPLVAAGNVSQWMRTILGVAIGASLTPQVISELPKMAASVALIPLFVLCIALLGVPFFRYVYRFDGVTAWYAAMPGGLQDMVMFGKEAGGDVRALSLIHATRLLIIITIAPIILTQVFDADIKNPIGQPASEIPPYELVIMALTAIIGWHVAKRLRIFGAPMIGPMILAGALSITGIINYRPPAEAILTAQFFIGIALGAGYVGVTLADIRRDVAAGIFFVIILAILTFIFTEIATLIAAVPPVDAFLAFAPAGQAEMTVFAIIVGADLGYVVVHHLSRVFLVVIGAPVAARVFGASPTNTETPDDPPHKPPPN
ncbi:hypothetical protein OAN307_63p00410 (plasmid) [Octadecabacter antarcticus 307]|uniref:Ammonia monooxygenase n=1 Tax=Octadecabacter antarcticus 307 TaxID=391626 RepID=M9RCC0_9RHOB|nr:AbrB family transcriptional regulator [Octadecabacter antarcticus]AGI70259.1 hypothetical protein OAN307_63p00410 [Octadecabacter antarcticus 307]